MPVDLKAPPPRVARAPEWKMPRIHVGDVVLWYPTTDKDVPPFAAIVTAVGNRSVAVNIADKQFVNFNLRDGVRHRSDPDLTDYDANDAGTWDYTEGHKELTLLRRQVHELAAASGQGGQAKGGAATSQEGPK